MLNEIGRGFRLTLIFTIALGLAYPGAVTAAAQLLFPAQANGSLVALDGRVVGSRLIGQGFIKAEYFHPRPSAAGGGYDAAQSAGSNLGPTSRRLIDRIRASADDFRRENPDFSGPIPADLLAASASGLDPDISPAAAEAQAARVAKSRGVSLDEVRRLAADFTTPADLGFLGEPRVNVLLLNIALDRVFPPSP